jgi:hypothetical protein
MHRKVGTKECVLNRRHRARQHQLLCLLAGSLTVRAFAAAAAAATTAAPAAAIGRLEELNEKRQSMVSKLKGVEKELTGGLPSRFFCVYYLSHLHATARPCNSSCADYASVLPATALEMLPVTSECSLVSCCCWQLNGMAAC